MTRRSFGCAGASGAGAGGAPSGCRSGRVWPTSSAIATSRSRATRGISMRWPRSTIPPLASGDWTPSRKPPAQGRTVKAFNPVTRPDSQLFVALMSGEHAVHGFANRDLRAKLTDQLREDPKQQSAQISRLLHRLHVYGLVAKIPRSRRWRVTAFGHRVMGASVRLRQLHFPAIYAEAA